MICPRCGISNQSGRTACTRCAGSLVSPPVRDDRPLPPVKPLTGRAEVMMRKAEAAARAAGGAGDAAGRTDGARAGALQPGGGAGVSGLETGDLYLMASDRTTGQPEPPGASQRDTGAPSSQAGQRTDRFVPRFSPAP